MNIIHIPSIDEERHSIDTSLLTPGGWVLDAGCRGFCFSRALAELRAKVLALDPSPEVVDPQIPNVTFLRKAVTARPGIFQYVQAEDRMGSYIVDDRLKALRTDKQPAKGPVFEVEGVTIQELLEIYKAEKFDLVKLDIEGAEYELLERWPGPVARQISVEFHEHYRKVLPEGSAYFERMLPHMSQWYHLVQADPMDCLFVEIDSE